ncbi:MAG: DNA mismatch repair protein MutS [Romboutsia sp.]
MEDGINFIFAIICVVLIVLGFSLIEHIKKLKYIKKTINSKYGKEIDIEDMFINMESVSNYFRNKKDLNERLKSIDDITWNDLGLDDVFKKINNTQSIVGEDILYNILRNPIHNKEKLEKIDNLIRYFNDNEKQRKEIQYILGKLGKSKGLYASNCLFNKEDLSSSNLIKYRILSIIPFISLILIFVNPYFLILLLGSMFFNGYVSQNTKKKSVNTDGFSYIIGTIKVANIIKKMNINSIEINLDNIEQSLKKVKSIKKRNIAISSDSVMSDIDLFREYSNMIFLTELINHEKAKNTIIKYKEDFKAIYEYVGTIDALIAVASFRETLKFYTNPKFEKSSSISNKLEFIDIYHPLIKKPVLNSARFYKGVILTGSNASGKSTFIKTIAINAILSQTIYTSLAKEYKSSFFDIYTSMALKDDIFSNESYYIVEIKSLKRILESINDDTPCLCFVDEILRGTNTVERIAASSEVLSFLGDKNCICISATHDIELTSILENKFDNYHFEENITDKEIIFDYKLRCGESKTRNAIKLLEFMGYNKTIAENAENKARYFLENKTW